MTTRDTANGRRQYLKAIGVTAGVAGLAGCSGDGDDGSPDTTTDTTTDADTTTTGEDPTTTTTTTTTEGTPVDSRFTAPLSMSDPTKGQFNPFNGKLGMDSRGWHYDPLVRYNLYDKEFLPRVAEDWDLGDESVLIHVNPDYVWTELTEDGPGETRPVTAEDLALDWEFEKFIATDWPADRPIVDWEVKDDQTLELVTADDTFNDLIFNNRVLTRTITTPRMMWADHAEELRNMEKGSEAFNSYLKENVLDYRMSASELWIDGPFYFDDVLAKRQVRYRKNPNYPRADQMEVERRNLVKVGSGRESNVQAMMHDEIDHHPQTPLSPTVAEKLPDHWDRVVTSGGLGAAASYFNHRAQWTGKSEVRQAIRYAVNNKDVTRNVNRSPIDPKVTGMANQTLTANWLGDLWGSFTSYGGSQTDVADEKMRAAGAERNADGWWADPSGDPIEMDFKAISGWTTAIVMNRTMVSQLRDWGLKAESVGLPSSEFFSDHWTDPSEMKPFAGIKYPLFSSPYVFHPFYYGNAYYLNGNIGKRAGSGHTYEVPATIGDPDSAVETVDAPKLADELGHVDDVQRQKEITERLSWLYNQNVPAFINNKPAGHHWYTHDDWSYPTVEEARSPPQAFENFGVNELIAQGTLTPEYEEG